MMSSRFRRGQNFNTVTLLQKLMPPQILIHAGAGSGQGEMHIWHDWPLAEAWLIDADSERLEWTTRDGTTRPGWHCRCAVLDAVVQPTTFYRASNPDEAGLLPPGQLQSIWPNLQTVATEQRESQRLDMVLAESSAGFADTWILIDCLPALPLLMGAGSWLEHCDVIWLRTLLKPIDGIDTAAALPALEEFLAPIGFRCAEIFESNHPAIGHALFVRDWKNVLLPRIAELSIAVQESQVAIRDGASTLQALTEIQQLYVSLNEKSIEQSHRTEELREALDLQTRIASENEVAARRLAATNAEQSRLILELRDEIASLSEAALAHEQNNAQLRTAVEELNRKSDAHSLEQKRHITELDELQREHSQLVSRLMADAAELTDKNTAIEVRNTRLLEEIGDLQQKDVANALKQKHLGELLEDLQQEHLSMLHAKEGLEQDLVSLNMAFEDSRAELAAMIDMEQQQRQKIADLTMNIEELRSSADVHMNERRELLQKISTLESELSAHVSEKGQLTKNIAALTMNIEDLRSSAVVQLNERQELLQKVSTLEGQLSAYVADKGQLTQGLDEARKAIDAGRELKVILEQENKILQTKVDDLKNMALHNADLEQQLSAARVEIRGLHERLKDLEQLPAKAAVVEEALTEQRRITEERQKQIEELVQARDVRAVQLAEHAVVLDTLNKAKASLEDEIVQLRTRQEELERDLSGSKQANEELTRLASDKQEKIIQLEAEVNEWETQQQMLFEEMTRAEGQIDLIKDVLLRETGL